MIDTNYNYLSCGYDKLAEDYDYNNRPDPDSASKKLYDDLIEAFFTDLPVSNRIQQFSFRGEDLKKNEAAWENYLCLNKYNPTCIAKDESKQPPFFTLVWKKHLMSADYIGPSVFWADKQGCTKETILNIVNIGRTIGGHIIWPRGKGKTVNQARGGDKSFYDRIEWTLFVLKAYYECNKNKEAAIRFVQHNYSQIEPKRYTEVLNAVDRYSVWFGEFDGFPDFCNRFLLKGSFVNESYEIVWMAPASPMFPSDYSQYVQNCLDAILRRNVIIMNYSAYKSGILI